jgi:CheY-like chemotaxis protein
VLKALHRADGTRDLPVVIVTSHTLDPEEQSRLADAFAIVSKQDLSRRTFAPVIQAAAGRNQRHGVPGPPVSL